VIQNKLSEIQDLKLSIQELKFEEGKDETDIRNWSAEVDENLKEYQGDWCRVETNCK
jgi:CHAD domain-containing protein